MNTSQVSKAVVALSGGMDSATVLGWLIEQGVKPLAVSFSYGSKHNKYEVLSAQAVAAYYSIHLETIDLSGAFAGFKSDLLETGGEIPEGHYTDESMLATVVPCRNIIFASIMAGYAWSHEAQAVALGIHQGDHAIYADCREDFFWAMNKALLTGTDQRIRLLAPFLETDKEGILEWGLSHVVPYDLTRTCYKDQSLACGKCGSCVERLEAFQRHGLRDPITYE